LPLSIQTNLTEISQQLDLISREIAIICYLVPSGHEEKHPPAAEIIASLKNIRNYPDKSGLLNRITTKLPRAPEDQKCHSLRVTTSTKDQSKFLLLDITCSSQSKQTLLEIYLSLLEMLRNDAYSEDSDVLVANLTSQNASELETKSVIFDATLKQISDALLNTECSNHKDTHGQTDPKLITTGIILLATHNYSNRM